MGEDNASMTELTALIDGNGKGKKANTASAATASKTNIPKAQELQTPVKRAPRQNPAVGQSTEVTPEQRIPLEGQDFKDI